MSRETVTRKAPLGEEKLRHMFKSSSDIQIMGVTLPQEEQPSVTVLLVYCRGLCDDTGINKYVVPDLKKMAGNHELRDREALEKYVPFHLVALSPERFETEIRTKVLEGQLVLVFEQLELAYAANLASTPKRKPEEPNTEVSTRGPKDGFTEEPYVNIGLIRKRLKSDKLAVEEYTIGSQTATKVVLLYMQDTINEKVRQTIQEKLKKLCVEGIVSTTQIEELLTRFSFFPLFAYTGRPDFAVNALMNGRFVLLAEGSPTAILAPVNFSFLINSAEDAHTFNIFVMFIRILRIFGVLISVFMPGFFIALVSFHQDQLPFTLLATLVNTRQGVPFPVGLEALVMLLLFEIFREAGMRLPSAFGQTLSVVGGLIIGQAAISAGIAAPGTTMVIAISVLSTFTLVNQSLVGAVSLIRAVVLLISSALGLFGVLICLITLVLYLVNLHSFGTYYLSPVSPLKFRTLYKTITRMPWGRKS